MGWDRYLDLGYRALTQPVALAAELKQDYWLTRNDLKCIVILLILLCILPGMVAEAGIQEEIPLILYLVLIPVVALLCVPGYWYFVPWIDALSFRIVGVRRSTDQMREIALPAMAANIAPVVVILMLVGHLHPLLKILTFLLGAVLLVQNCRFRRQMLEVSWGRFILAFLALPLLVTVILVVLALLIIPVTP